MKKIYGMIVVICLLAGTVHAQSNYLRLGVGGGVGLKQYQGYAWYDESESSSADNITIKSMGLGGGFNVNLAFGHMFSQFVGIELGVNEFIGLKKKTNQTVTDSYGERTQESKISGMMLQIVPAIVITPGLEKINPYARLGMIVGVLPSGTRTDNYTDKYTGGESLKVTHTSDQSQKLSGGVALGFTAAGGASFMLSEKLAFYGELVFNGISYSPSKGKLKTWTYDGVDQLPDATTNEKEWTYEKEFDANEEIPDGSPDKEAKTSVSFSNVLINIGITFRL